jgi:hypothetical protein
LVADDIQYLLIIYRRLQNGFQSVCNRRIQTQKKYADVGINEGTSKSQYLMPERFCNNSNKKKLVMEPNKFDQSIRKMEARTIVPSAEAWEN